MRTDYWAKAPIEEIADEITSKFKDYKKWLETTGYGKRIKATYRAFYAMNEDGTLNIVRDSNDIARINVNHLRSLIKRLHIMVTENKLGFQPRAKNSDSKSQTESDLGRGVCEYYNDEKKMNAKLREAVLGALIMFEQHIHCPWDLSEGYELTADNETIVKTGDQRYEVYSAFDVAKNTESETSNWFVIRQKVNKYDLAAMNPDYAEDIIGSGLDFDSFELDMIGDAKTEAQSDDYTHKYILYHARTPSMPIGREVEICATHVLKDSGCEVDDIGLLYDRMPVVTLTAGSVLQTCFGDSPAIDLLPLHESLNALWSAVTTNGLNNAVQMIYCPDENLKIRKLENGQTLLSATVPPIGLNLSNTSPDTFKLMDMFLSNEQLLSGVNDTARGNPSSNLKSGASLAIIMAQAIQYVSDLQSSYAAAAGDVATMTINNMQRFASEEMTAYVTGVSRKGQIKKFRAQDIMNIERVTVDLGNPLMQSMAGKRELIAEWTQHGVMKDPKQIVSFLRTGEVDQVTEDLFSDSIYIRDENELLRRGINPKVWLLDRHVEHILAHTAVNSSPEAREDDAIATALNAHIEDHIYWMRKVPPDLAAVLMGQPLPPAQGPMSTPGGEGPGGKPNISGARMPSMPEGTPAEVEGNYSEMLEAMPQEQGVIQ